jgi:hypothetical protein
LIKEIKNAHANLKLCGEPRNALLSAPDGAVAYILSLLKNELPQPPNLSKDEWAKLLGLLRPHWIIPLLYRQIHSLPQSLQPPAETVEQMRNIFFGSRIDSLKMEKQLKNLSAVFKNEGISALVLKGPALAHKVYPDPAARPCGDLDLLVKPEQVLKSRTVLEKMGYQCQEKRFEVFKDLHYHEIFTHPDGNNRQVEVHWGLQMFPKQKINLDLAELFRRAAEIRTPALTFRTLDPLDELIFISAHMILSHNWDIRLIWIYDIAAAAKKIGSRQEWETLEKRSAEWGYNSALAKAFELARLWTGLSLPVNSLSLKLSASEARAWSGSVSRFQQIAGIYKIFWGKDQSPAAKIRFLFNLLFPPPEFMRRKYPPRHKWLLPLSYIRRWAKWIKSIAAKEGPLDKLFFISSSGDN